MKYIKPLFYINIIIATISLVMGFTNKEYSPAALTIIVIGIFWGLSSFLSCKWVNSLSLAGFIAIAAIGTWLEVNLILLLVGVIGALIGWDLADFLFQEKLADRIDNEVRLVRVHFIRIAIITILGIGLSLLSRSIKMQITFAWALLLGMILVIALSRTTGYLKNIPKL
jgi:hypothetical protein